MAKSTGQRRTLLKELEARDRELARDMRDANLRTVRAVNATTRAMRGEQRAGRAVERVLTTAWRRPPKKPLRKQITTKVGGGRVARRRRTESSPSSVHFKLGLTHSGSAAKAHQRYIERPGAAIASFGNIADDEKERGRIWEAIEERTRKRKGVVKIGAKAPLKMKQAVLKSLDQFVEEGRIPERAANAIKRKAREEKGLGEIEIGLATTNKEDHRTFVEAMWGLSGETGREREKRRTKNTQLPPEGVRAYEPRAGIVQRRLVLELPHEISHEQMERSLRTWCMKHLEKGKVGYHAAIHQPERDNDERNWHAHVVFAQFETTRRKDNTGFEIDDGKKLPRLAPVMQRMSGNTTEKRKGVRELIKEWRKSWCDTLNEELRKGGHDKRYDARSYVDQGLNREAGQHLGPERTRIEGNAPEGGKYWEKNAPEWSSITKAWQKRVKELGGNEDTITEHTAHLERIRLMSGLAAQGIGENDPITQRLTLELDPERVGGESDRLLSLESALKETRRTLKPQWLNEWERIETEGLDRDARGRAAFEVAGNAGGMSTIEQWSKSGVGATADDLLAAARAHTSAVGQWTRRAKTALAQDTTEEERDQRALALTNTASEVGRKLEAMLHKADIEEIRERSERQRRRTNARNARTTLEGGLATASDPGAVARAASDLVQRNAQYWTQDAPDEGTTLRKWIEAAQGAARLRSDFRTACEGKGRIIEVLTRINAEDERSRAAVSILSEAEIEHMQSSARSENETRQEQHRIAQRASEMMKRLIGEGDERKTHNAQNIIACWNDEALKKDLAKGAPDRLAYLEKVYQEVETRRMTMSERIAQMGENREAAAIVWTSDPECLTLCTDAERRKTIEARSQEWVAQIEQEIRPRENEVPKAHQRRIATMLETPARNALERMDDNMGAELAKTIVAATRKEERDTESARAQAQMFEKMLTGKTANERRKGYAGLDKMLEDAVDRTRLGITETERLGRRRRHMPGSERQR